MQGNSFLRFKEFTKLHAIEFLLNKRNPFRLFSMIFEEF